MCPQFLLVREIDQVRSADVLIADETRVPDSFADVALERRPLLTDRVQRPDVVPCRELDDVLRRVLHDGFRRLPLRSRFNHAWNGSMTRLCYMPLIHSFVRRLTV